MLLVKTCLAPSDVHGIGLFAAEPIPKGTVIWRYDERIDRCFTRQELDALPELTREFVDTYGYPDGSGDGTFQLDGDNARFMNHSEQANTDSSGGDGTIATRDIAVGEEILSDYRQFNPTHRYR